MVRGYLYTDSYNPQSSFNKPLLVGACIRSLQEGNVFSRMCPSGVKGRDPHVIEPVQTCSLWDLHPFHPHPFKLVHLNPAPGGPTQTCSLGDPLFRPIGKQAVDPRLKRLSC